MSSCSGDPSNCSFCGSSKADCAKDAVSGCSANPASCTVCNGACVATECTGNVATCKACSAGHFSTCRKAAVSASEGVEPARPRA
ncbi:hypothetical protein Q5752_004711 [Cryptotrichosporon argae]